MKKYERVRFDMFIRVAQFITDNASDFAVGGVVLTQLTVLQAVIVKLQTLMGDQSEGLVEARFGFNSKDIARENLRDLLSLIARTARSMVYEFPGVDLKFRMPRNRNDAELLGKANAFLTEATPLALDFERYEMEKNFTTDLQNRINEFEASLSAPASAIDEHVAATAETGAEIRKGMIAVRTMQGAVKNKYKNNVGKLAAWLSASHIETSKPKDAPTTPNP